MGKIDNHRGLDKGAPKFGKQCYVSAPCPRKLKGAAVARRVGGSRRDNEELPSLPATVQVSTCVLGVSCGTPQRSRPRGAGWPQEDSQMPGG